jgi:hypothetical protein
MSTPTQGLAIVTPATAGQPVAAIDANQAGGYITNPINASDQGLGAAEPLYVDQVNPAKTSANGTTIALQPGQTYAIVPYTSTQVSVASASASHSFTAVQWTAP